MKSKHFAWVFLLYTSFLFSQNNDFNNGGGNFLWSNPANWSQGAVPNLSNTGQVRLPILVTSQVDTDVSIKKIQNIFGSTGNVSVGGASVLTLNPGVANNYAIENVSGSGVNISFNGNVTLNNAAGFSRMRNINNAGNSIEFANGSVFTLDSGLELFTGASNGFNFNGSLAGNGNFRLSANTAATFGSTSSNPSFTGEFVFLLNSQIVVNTADDNVFYNGPKLQVNGNSASIVLNGANVLAANAVIIASNTFTITANKNQNNLGVIVFDADGTLNLNINPAVTNLSFSNNAASSWNAGTLNITGFQSGVIRFGTNSSGLTSTQLSQIVADNGNIPLTLDSNGYLINQNSMDSDIIADASFSYPENIPYQNFQTSGMVVKKERLTEFGTWTYGRSRRSPPFS
jgi:hypothetical protein